MRQAWHMRLTRDSQWCSRARQRPISQRVEGGKAVCRVRGGVVLPFMDGATIYDAELFELLRNACDKRGIRWQTKTRVAGGTDAGRIHKSRAGVRCARLRLRYAIFTRRPRWRQ